MQIKCQAFNLIELPGCVYTRLAECLANIEGDESPITHYSMGCENKSNQKNSENGSQPIVCILQAFYQTLNLNIPLHPGLTSISPSSPT